jgi:hypothetical protein
MDAGAACMDSLSGAVSEVVITNPVDVEKTGEYVVTYRARDSAGNWNDGSCKGSKQYLRTVQVVDTLKPIIALKYTHASTGVDTHLAHMGHGNEYSSITGVQNPAGDSFRSALQAQADAEGGHVHFRSALLSENTKSFGGPWVVAAVGALVAGIAMLAMRKQQVAPAFNDV